MASVSGWQLDRVSPAGGSVALYAVNPSLPPGLALDSSTGVLAGTPTAVTSLLPFTVTARNTAGDATHVLALSVDQRDDCVVGEVGGMVGHQVADAASNAGDR